MRGPLLLPSLEFENKIKSFVKHCFRAVEPGVPFYNLENPFIHPQRCCCAFHSTNYCHVSISVPLRLLVLGLHTFTFESKG